MGGGGGGDYHVRDSELEKEMARIGREKWIAYNQSYVPAEREWMQQIDKMTSTDNFVNKTGMSNAATQSAYSHAMNELLSQGGNMSRMNAGINSLATNQLRAGVDNNTRVQESIYDQWYGGLMAINQIGRGKEATALGSLYDSANLSNQYAMQSARNNYIDENANNQAIGMGLGALTRYGVGE